MKINYFLLSVFVLFLSFSLSAGSSTHQDWDKFSRNLVMAIENGNDGLRQSAMQLIIKNVDQLWVNDAAPAILEIYYNNENEKMRQLALVTLFKIENPAIASILRNEFENEKSPVLKHQLLCFFNNKIKTENFVSR